MVVPIRGLIRKASFKMENIIRNNYDVSQTNDVSNISLSGLSSQHAYQNDTLPNVIKRLRLISIYITVNKTIDITCH